jgi:GNAT superfamily N-acetyltransferase
MILTETTPDAIVPLRHQVLRPNRPISECQYASDREPGTFHVALSLDDQIIGCASAFLSPAPGRTEPAYQLRGMAVLEAYRNAGLGAQLLEAIEAGVLQRGVRLIWCNGRISAERFYRRHGWIDEGEVFDIVGIPHRIFVKHLSPSA